MKTLLHCGICTFMFIAAQASDVTLTVSAGGYGPVKLKDEVAIATNDTAQVTSCYGSSYGTVQTLRIIKDGLTNSFNISGLSSVGTPSVAGPATIRLETSSSGSSVWFCSLHIEPSSFPPGQTIILPQGTVGVIHVESSTNLVQWQDEWVHTFSNTNQNRFYRLRADRSLQ
jgi:hypothetical protein